MSDEAFTELLPELAGRAIISASRIPERDEMGDCGGDLLLVLDDGTEVVVYSWGHHAWGTRGVITSTVKPETT